ncbi:unnamed protein product [Rhizophagus irregularis]|nr:unnamed protein product [Rhizophagus irregularis]CAB5375085.1 unnamed protein product [Rhizophagus irregularis]
MDTGIPQGNRLQYGYRNPARKSAPNWILESRKKSAPNWIPESRNQLQIGYWNPARNRLQIGYQNPARNRLQIGYRNPAGKSSPICRNKWELRNLMYTGFVRKLG